MGDGDEPEIAECWSDTDANSRYAEGDTGDGRCLCGDRETALTGIANRTI